MPENPASLAAAIDTVKMRLMATVYSKLPISLRQKQQGHTEIPVKHHSTSLLRRQEKTIKEKKWAETNGMNHLASFTEPRETFTGLECWSVGVSGDSGRGSSIWLESGGFCGASAS